MTDVTGSGSTERASRPSYNATILGLSWTLWSVIEGAVISSIRIYGEKLGPFNWEFIVFSSSLRVLRLFVIGPLFLHIQILRAEAYG